MSDKPLKRTCSNCKYSVHSRVQGGALICTSRNTYAPERRKCNRFKWSEDAIMKRLDRIEKKLDKIDFNVR